MKQKKGVELGDVQEVYSGPEMELWELLMGQQIHLGGAESTNQLWAAADISPESAGVDLCCCTGEGMRYLVSCFDVKAMTGVDVTQNVIQLGENRTVQAGLQDRISFVQAEATDSTLPSGNSDFIWGEDAWCYVDDKPALIAEAARLTSAGGTIAFTDWMEGDGMSDQEAQRFLGFMKFANIIRMDEYSDLLKTNGCDVQTAQDTGRFVKCVELYLGMLKTQHAYDAMKILGHDKNMLDAVIGEMEFIHSLAKAGKIHQGLIVARKGTC